MSSIVWKSGQSGSWNSKNNWSPADLPGPASSVVIGAASLTSKNYTVTLTGHVTVASLALQSKTAVLADKGSLNAGMLQLQTGTLAVAGGTLSGTVSQTGGTLGLYDTGSSAALVMPVLNNVTWEGKFDPITKTSVKNGVPTLTVLGGLTLTGAGGSGPGSGTVDGVVALNAVTSLDNAALTVNAYDLYTLYDVTVTNSPTLTLGAGLTLNTPGLSTGGALVNNGNYTGALIAGSFTNNGTASLDVATVSGTLINNGVLTEGIKLLGDYYTAYTNQALQAASITNNGTILLNQQPYDFMDGVNLGAFTAPGAHGQIDVAGGILTDDQNITPAGLQAALAAQHVVTSGSFGLGVAAGYTLDNSGTTLDIGAGTYWGLMGALTRGTISGGTVVDSSETTLTANLSKLTYDAATSTLTVSQFDLPVSLDNVTFNGVSTLVADGTTSLAGTISGAGTLLAYTGQGTFDLNGVTFAGPEMIVNHAAVQLGAGQSLAGVTVTSGAGAAIYAAPGADLDAGTLTSSANTATTSIDYVVHAEAGAGSVTLGAGLTIIDPAATTTNGGIALDNFGNNMPVIVIDTPISDAHLIGLDGNQFVNNSVLSVSAGGTIYLTDTGLSGSGTLALTGVGGQIVTSSAIGAGQIIQFGGSGETLFFASTAAAQSCQATLSGFSAGDTISLQGVTLTSADFAGETIVAALSGGGSIVLNTSTALSGGLSVSEVNGTVDIVYSAARVTAGHGTALSGGLQDPHTAWDHGVLQSGAAHGF